MTGSSIPLARPLNWAYALSLVVALLMAGASLAGLLAQSSLYPTAELRRSFVSNDVVNLFIGLPSLLGSLWLARRGRLVGLLVWPGALFYVTYNYIAYAVARPFTAPFAVYLGLVALSVVVLMNLIAAIDSAAVRRRLSGAVWERLSGGVSAGFGTLFFLRAIGILVTALAGWAPLGGPDLGVLVADLLTTPAWVIGGVWLWRRQALGYVAGLGLLFQASLLFIGLLIFFVLQPVLAAAPFPVGDFVVILVMGLAVFVPLGLFLGGVAAK